MLKHNITPEIIFETQDIVMMIIYTKIKMSIFFSYVNVKCLHV